MIIGYIRVSTGKCLKKGVNIYTTKERYRFDDSINSKILCFAFGLVAEIERNLISLRTKEALAMRRSEGVVLGRPTGNCTKQQILHDNEKQVLRMLEAGTFIRAICRHFKVSKDTWYRYKRQQQNLITVHKKGPFLWTEQIIKQSQSPSRVIIKKLPSGNPKGSIKYIRKKPCISENYLPVE